MSWEWKEWRKNLALEKGDFGNKAGRNSGQGTTSKARQARRAHLQPQPPPEKVKEEWEEPESWQQNTCKSEGYTWEGDTWPSEAWTGNTWQSDTWEDWEDDTWQSDTWTADTWQSDTWTDDTWQSDTWQHAGCKPKRSGSRASSKSSQRSRSQRRRSSSRSSGSSAGGGPMSVDWDNSSSESRSSSPARKKLVWHKKEKERHAWHLSSNYGVGQLEPVLEEAKASEKGGEPEKAPEKVDAQEQGKEVKEEPSHETPEKGKPSQSQEEEPQKTLEKGKPGQSQEEPSQNTCQEEPSQKTSEKGKPSQNKILAKGEPSQEENTPEKGAAPASKPKTKVMIDFHNVLEVNGYVPDQHIEAIQELLGLGHEVVVCSYAFAKREKEVMRTLQSWPFWGQLSNAFCIRERTGRWGKSSWAVHLGCTALFDDGADICQEAAWLNLRTFPIRCFKEKHNWAKAEGIQVCSNLQEAIQAFLQDS